MPRASERAARGRLIAQGTACWRACAERCEARKARIERLFVGREKNLCELTRAHLSSNDKMTGIEGWRLGGHDHEVSILITGVGGVGWWRGLEPRSKRSMMSMRPPQHGQRCSLAFAVRRRWCSLL